MCYLVHKVPGGNSGPEIYESVSELLVGFSYRPHDLKRNKRVYYCTRVVQEELFAGEPSVYLRETRYTRHVPFCSSRVRVRRGAAPARPGRARGAPAGRHARHLRLPLGHRVRPCVVPQARRRRGDGNSVRYQGVDPGPAQVARAQLRRRLTGAL